MLDVPPVFRVIQREATVAWREMYQVFNCGHLMELYVSPERAGDVIAAAHVFGIDAQVIGDCEDTDQPGVIIRGPFGEHVYPRRA